MSKETKLNAYYTASNEENLRRIEVYGYIDEMMDLKKQPMPHFSCEYGERSWTQYVEDSEKIINGYTMSREQQGKEEWQSNVLDNVTRAKMRAIAAGVGLKVPEMSYSAVNKNGIRSNVRANIFKNIAKHSFNDGNPVLHSFLEVWTMLSHGVIFEYEGYKTGGAKQKRVVSFDSLTGEVETKEEYREMDGKPFSAIINPQEFFWWDFEVRDMQEQPRVAWIQHYSKRELKLEFSKFPNFKYIQDKAEAGRFAPLMETTYYKKWSQRVDKKDDYEVIRYYSLSEDAYEVWINGIPMLQAPMLWGDDEKYYPFAKSIIEPFANTNFFVGMSFPHIMEAYQDAKNTIMNTMIDKLYRSMEAPMLVGLGNRDLFDVESEFVNQDNRYYVPDVNQVKPMPIQGIQSGELSMLQILERNIETISIDRAQQGMQSGISGKTASEVRIADARARELKGILGIFHEDLWLQKTRLRNRNILTHYIKDKASRTDLRDNTITMKGYDFSDGTRGTLDIHIAKSKNDLLPITDIEAREQAMAEQGEVYKLISVTTDYIDEYKYDFEIMPQSLKAQDDALEEAKLDNEVQWIATIYPEFMVANRDKYLKEKLAFRGKHPDEFNPPVQPPPPGMEGGGSSPTSEALSAGGGNSPTEQGAGLLAA